MDLDVTNATDQLQAVGDEFLKALVSSSKEPIEIVGLSRENFQLLHGLVSDIGVLAGRLKERGVYINLGYDPVKHGSLDFS